MFSGKESSPMGLGYCPDGEVLGKEMTGKDGHMWVVRAPKGIKMWTRVNAEEKKLIREEPILINTESDDKDGDDALEDPFGWKPTNDSDDEPEDKLENEKDADEVPPVVIEDVKPEPKKRGRPPKAKNVLPENVKPMNDDKQIVDNINKPEPKKQRGRPPKAKNDNDEIKDDKKVKPRAKKNDDEEKKERKPRAKTEYNEFLSTKMKELREKHKDDTEKLKTTEYLKMAIADWKVYKESKAIANA